tara:strand:- start:1534 stop:1938 length:405 start_codon:yes stop_codon:yes gene_type:complete
MFRRLCFTTQNPIKRTIRTISKYDKAYHQIIKNPVGFEATDVTQFTINECKRIIPSAMLVENSMFVNQTTVLYPRNCLFGVEIDYEPISTLGKIHQHDKNMSEYGGLESGFSVRYACYNGLIFQLPNENEQEIE